MLVKEACMSNQIVKGQYQKADHCLPDPWHIGADFRKTGTASDL